MFSSSSPLSSRPPASRMFRLLRSSHRFSRTCTISNLNRITLTGFMRPTARLSSTQSGPLGISPNNLKYLNNPLSTNMDSAITRVGRNTSCPRHRHSRRTSTDHPCSRVKPINRSSCTTRFHLHLASELLARIIITSCHRKVKLTSNGR